MFLPRAVTASACECRESRGPRVDWLKLCWLPRKSQGSAVSRSQREEPHLEWEYSVPSIFSLHMR